MIRSAVLFAILAGASAATWSVCLKLGAARINVALAAMVITGAAFVVNSMVMLVMRARGHEIALRADAVWLLALAGIAAAGVDTFGLLAYEHGLRLTSSLIIGGTSTALVLFVGFLLLGEPVTWLRALAIAFVATGILLFQLEGG
jgi:drug/metabolite transporter (DMT)-like permease